MRASHRWGAIMSVVNKRPDRITLTTEFNTEWNKITKPIGDEEYYGAAIEIMEKIMVKADGKNVTENTTEVIDRLSAEYEETMQAEKILEGLQ